MAGPWYYRHLASGTADGLSWTNARTSLTTMTSVVAGDTIYVADDHAETAGSAKTITFPGTTDSPNLVYCADRTVATPGTGDLKTTGTVSTTGASNISLNGSAYIYGLTFAPGSGANLAGCSLSNTAGDNQIFEACKIQLGGTSGGNISGNAQGWVRLKNTTIQVASTSSAIGGRARFIWTDGSLTGATFPSTLFTLNGGGTILFEGVDLSPMGTGKMLTSGISYPVVIILKDFKLPSSFTPQSNTSNSVVEIIIQRSDSSGTNYRNEKYVRTGQQIIETSITRTGGASDGTTAVSWKFSCNSNAKFTYPFEALPIAVWNDTSGSSKTVTIEGTWNSGSRPDNDDLWIEVEYLGSSSSPVGSRGTTAKANNLASATTYSSSAASWGGGGSGAGWSPFAMSVTFTPQQKGMIYIYPKIVTTTNVYICPKPTIT